MPYVIYGTTANNRARAQGRLSLYPVQTNSYRSERRSLSANESGIYYSLSTCVGAGGAMKTSRGRGAAGAQFAGSAGRRAAAAPPRRRAAP